MKKLLCTLLAVILLLGCLPTMAVEDFDPPLWEEYGYQSLDIMLKSWDMTEEEYYEMVESEREWRDWEYDEATGDFNTPVWDMVYGYESLEAMLEDWEITLDEYYELVEEERLNQEMDSWTDEQWDKYFEEYDEKQLQNERKAYGLVNDISVVLRNKAVAFPDAVPELVNSRVMIPMRAVMENLGAEVAFDQSTKIVSISCEGKAMQFTLGETALTVTENEESTTIELDCAPYIKSDRVFVPVRFVAEALGYDVLWSDYFKTAVLLDKTAIIDELNQNYTIANKALSMGQDLSLDLTKNYKGDTSMDIKITKFDSISGDKIYNGGFDAVVLQNGMSMKMSFSMDIGFIVDLMKDVATEYGYIFDMNDIEEITNIIEPIDGATTDLIIDLDSNMAYFRGELVSLVLEQEDIDLDSKSWLSIDLSVIMDEIGFDMQDFYDAMEQMDLTIGSQIYTSNMYGWMDPLYTYEYMLSTADGMSVLNDSAFKKTNSGYSYYLDLSTESDYFPVSGNVKADLSMNGDAISKIKGSVECLVSGFQIEMDFSLSAKEARMSGSFHMKNTFILDFDIKSTVKETSSTVPTAPPADDKVVNLDDLIA